MTPLHTDPWAHVWGTIKKMWFYVLLTAVKTFPLRKFDGDVLMVKHVEATNFAKIEIWTKATNSTEELQQ